MAKKKAIKVMAAVAAIGALGAYGVSAYFTDGDTATNTFTVGKISLDLQEPSWDEENPPEDITPNEEFDKDPQVYNDGVNDEYVFVTVDIPYAEITVAEQDGTKADSKANTELFTMLDEDGAEGINDGWLDLGYVNADGKIIDSATASTAKFLDSGVVRHLYAYVGNDSATLEKLTAEGTTPAVFSAVRFVNAVEDEGLEGATEKIVVNAYGIQTDNIEDTVGKGNNDGETSPAEVWAVVRNANPETAVSETEDGHDVKESNQSTGA